MPLQVPHADPGGTRPDGRRVPTLGAGDNSSGDGGDRQWMDNARKQDFDPQRRSAVVLVLSWASAASPESAATCVSEGPLRRAAFGGGWRDRCWLKGGIKKRGNMWMRVMKKLVSAHCEGALSGRDARGGVVQELHDERAIASAWQNPLLHGSVSDTNLYDTDQMWERALLKPEIQRRTIRAGRIPAPFDPPLSRSWRSVRQSLHGWQSTPAP